MPMSIPNREVIEQQTDKETTPAGHAPACQAHRVVFLAIIPIQLVSAAWRLKPVDFSQNYSSLMDFLFHLFLTTWKFCFLLTVEVKQPYRFASGS
ncbi:hypothetical protein BC629DRAFT_1484367 [Irpex lacteus]|nr:hypothetical protein BC629DRAFT_1484367 [Irpex lacteus]